MQKTEYVQSALKKLMFENLERQRGFNLSFRARGPFLNSLYCVSVDSIHNSKTKQLCGVFVLFFYSSVSTSRSFDMTCSWAERLGLVELLGVIRWEQTCLEKVFQLKQHRSLSLIFHFHLKEYLLTFKAALSSSSHLPSCRKRKKKLKQLKYFWTPFPPAYHLTAPSHTSRTTKPSRWAAVNIRKRRLRGYRVNPNQTSQWRRFKRRIFRPTRSRAS